MDVIGDYYWEIDKRNVNTADLTTRRQVQMSKSRQHLRTEPNMSSLAGYESLIYHVLLQLDSMGSSRPKNVEKLRSAVKKWQKAVEVFDPFDALGKDTFTVKVGRQVSVRVPVTTVVKNLQKNAVNSAKRSDLAICLIDDRCSYGKHLITDMRQKAHTFLSGVVDQCPEFHQFQEKMDQLVQMLQLSVNGSYRQQSTTSEALLNNLLKTCLSNLQMCNYIVIDANERVTYNFPSDFLMRVMHNVLINYQEAIKENFEEGFCVKYQTCCTALQAQCDQANHSLDDLVAEMKVDEETKNEMLSIYSEALDALHKFKSEPPKPSHQSVPNERQNVVSSSKHNKLFKYAFLNRDPNDSGSHYSRSRSRSWSRSRSRSRSRSNTPSSVASDSIDNLSRLPPRRSRSNTPDVRVQSRSRSESPSRDAPNFSDGSCSSGSVSRRWSSTESERPDLGVRRRPKKRSAVRSLSPNSKRQKYKNQKREKAEDISVDQAQTLSQLLNLEFFGTSETEKINDFEELCTTLKSLTVADIEKIPDTICLIDLIILDALYKMGDSKPKTLKALMNALRPVCKVLFVLNPGKLAIQTKPKRNPKGRAKSSQQPHIPLITLQLSETISLNKGNLFKPDTVPYFLNLDFPTKPDLNRRKNTNPLHSATKEVLQKLKMTGLTTQADLDKCEVYGKLVQTAQFRARSISSTVIKTKREQKGYYTKKFVEWKQTVIRMRDHAEPMESSEPMEGDDHEIKPDLDVDFTNRNRLYEDLVHLFVKTQEISFDKLLSLLLETKLITQTPAGDILYAAEFEKDQWKSEWKSHEEVLLKNLHFKENDNM